MPGYLGDPSPVRRIRTLSGAIRRQDQIIDHALDIGDREALHHACRERARLQGRIRELLECLIRGHQVAAGGQ